MKIIYTMLFVCLVNSIAYPMYEKGMEIKRKEGKDKNRSYIKYSKEYACFDTTYRTSVWKYEDEKTSYRAVIKALPVELIPGEKRTFYVQSLLNNNENTQKLWLSYDREFFKNEPEKQD